MAYDKLKRTRLTDKVVKIIYDELCNGKLKAGDKLASEIELSEQLGIARTTIREAYSQLIGLGLVERGNYGLYVTKDPTKSVQAGLGSLLLKNWELSKLFEARMAIEGEIIMIACEKASNNDIRALREINEQMRCFNNDEKNYWKKDMEFHNKIVEICDNEILSSMRQIVYDMFEKFEEQVTQLESVKQRTYQWHADIVTAFENKDGEKARVVTYESFAASEEGLSLLGVNIDT